MHLPSPAVRQSLYAIASAGLTLLVGYNLIAPEQAPLWLNLIGAIFAITATSTATVAVNRQRADGTLPDRPPRHLRED